MTQDEIALFNLIDAYASRFGYGVSKIEADTGGTFHRVELTNPERDGFRSIMVPLASSSTNTSSSSTTFRKPYCEFALIT